MSTYTLYVNKLHEDGTIEEMACYEKQQLDGALSKLRTWLRTAPDGAAFDLTIAKESK